MPEPAIVFDNVGLRLGGTAIYDGLSFEVAAGEFVCLLGPSGCGKSTALRLVGDLLHGATGAIRIAGRPAAEAWDRFAYVFQSPRLLPWKSALDNAAFGLEMRRPSMPREHRRAKALEELTRVGLHADAEKMPSILSGGEKQRVSIARALALDPDIILMDEPFSALDPNTRVKLRRQVTEIWEGTGKSVLFVTHDIDEALVLADRIIVLTPKPATVTRDVTVTAKRPRDIENDPDLRRIRRDLLDLFHAMGEPIPEETNP